MRTNKNLYLFAAALVAGTMGMTSCSNEVVPEVETNPTYNGESVKTQFALNIPAGKNTRMSGTNTQQDGNFLGMQNIKLLPLFDTPAGGETVLKQIISLADFGSSDWAADKGNVKVYSDVNIPVGTKNFLFYAEADGTTVPSTGTQAFEHGYLENNLAADNLVKVSDINFNLSKIASGFTYNTQIPAALNSIAQVEGWKTYATTPDNSTKPLAKLYNRFTDLTAGSAASVKLVLEALKVELEKLPADESYNALLGNIKSAVNNAQTTVSSLTFPQDYNLPDGVVELQWDDTSGFSYKENETVIGSLTINPANICYPASLTYFVNTPLRATSAQTVDFPSSTNWGSEGIHWNNWTTTAVDATTTGIALKYAINYAVANLETTVKCKTNVLEDNAYAMTNHAEQNRKVMVHEDGFPVTGILIGGQPNSVDWQLLPATDDSREMMVYDKNIAEGMAAKAGGALVSNYTLVLDNRKITATGLSQAEKINIAVEFTNNTGTDFYGADGLIKAGATFYMLAQLDPTSKSDNSGEYKSVFQQDYKTVANLTIASLKSAYNCIPDLRSTQLQLGMAVDLKWEAGLNFDITIE